MTNITFKKLKLKLPALLALIVITICSNAMAAHSPMLSGLDLANAGKTIEANNNVPITSLVDIKPKLTEFVEIMQIYSAGHANAEKYIQDLKQRLSDNNFSGTEDTLRHIDYAIKELKEISGKERKYQVMLLDLSMVPGMKAPHLEKLMSNAIAQAARKPETNNSTKTEKPCAGTESTNKESCSGQQNAVQDVINQNIMNTTQGAGGGGYSY